MTKHEGLNEEGVFSEPEGLKEVTAGELGLFGWMKVPQPDGQIFEILYEENRSKSDSLRSGSHLYARHKLSQMGADGREENVVHVDSLELINHDNGYYQTVYDMAAFHPSITVLRRISAEPPKSS